MIPDLGMPVFQLNVEGNPVNVYFWDDKEATLFTWEKPDR